jgi:type II pantothenate kinase
MTEDGIHRSATAVPLLSSRFGMDIGGTLTKIAYFEKRGSPDEDPEEAAERQRMRELLQNRELYGSTGHRDTHLEFDSDELGGHLYFLRFETHRMASFFDMIRKQRIANKNTILHSTGGGARKYASEFKDILGRGDMPKLDELSCLIEGINVMLKHNRCELYQVDHKTFV